MSTPITKLAPSPKHPPHSMEAEQSVLGGLLLNNKAWYDLSDQISESDFYTLDHRIIFRAISEILTRGKPCDFVTLSEYLRERNKLEDAGGLSYLGTLAADTPSAANVKAYAEIVRERSILRNLISAGQDIAELGYQPGGREASELMEAAEKAVFQIRMDGERSRGGFQDMPTLMSSLENRLDLLKDNPSALMGLRTGFTEFDKLTNGLHEGDLIIVAGRPGMGKTSFAMNIAENVAVLRSNAVAVFSMEMSADQLALRVMSSFGRIDMQRLRSGEMRDQDWASLVQAGGQLREAPLFIDDTGSLSPGDLLARSRRLKAQHDIKLIVIDYIQLMQVPGIKENRTNEVSEISRSLKALAKELRVPVIALSQLSRGVEARDNKRPRMSDLRESGSIEQDADVIVFVYRDEYYNKESPDKGTAEIILGKQRNGPIDTIKTAFIGPYTRFDNLIMGNGFDY